MSISAKQRLNRLVNLAAQSGSQARQKLVGELADLLLAWPPNYPADMREPFEALLEKALRDVDRPTRATLAQRFSSTAEVPTGILNLLIFDASPDVKTAILSRNVPADARKSKAPTMRPDETNLAAAVRQTAVSDMPALLGTRFGLGENIAELILSDRSAYCLAVLCKGAGVQRAIFSTLALLAQPDAEYEDMRRRLAAYEAVPRQGAEAIVEFWRAPLPAAAANPQAA